MNKEKALGYIELAGLASVCVGAATWIVNHNLGSIIMAVGTLALLIGRFFQTPFYTKYSILDPKELTLRRLYHQRVFGIIALILATALMFTPQGFYFGVWVGATSWLVLFVIFVVIEVYTAFRISAVDNA